MNATLSDLAMVVVVLGLALSTLATRTSFLVAGSRWRLRFMIIPPRMSSSLISRMPGEKSTRFLRPRIGLTASASASSAS